MSSCVPSCHRGTGEHWSSEALRQSGDAVKPGSTECFCGSSGSLDHPALLCCAHCSPDYDAFWSSELLSFKTFGNKAFALILSLLCTLLMKFWIYLSKLH